MSEWWTYTPADFLMFSSRTYWRLVALYNEAVWPWHFVAIGVGCVVLKCVTHPTAQRRRIAMLLLMVAWAWIAWAYHMQRYGDISTAAPYFAIAFAIQALLLCFLAVKGKDGVAGKPKNCIGLVILVLAVFAYPLLAPASGRPWSQAEVVGISPDPTVIATLAVLLTTRMHWSAWMIPLVWCVVSAATLVELRVPHAWLLPAVGTVSVVAGLSRRRRSQLFPD